LHIACENLLSAVKTAKLEVVFVGVSLTQIESWNSWRDPEPRASTFGEELPRGVFMDYFKSGETIRFCLME
jgi:hypothetical protein